MTARSMMSWTCYWLGDGVHETIKPTFGRCFDWPHRLYQWRHLCRLSSASTLSHQPCAQPATSKQSEPQGTRSEC
jgi:hypothetical protein